MSLATELAKMRARQSAASRRKVAANPVNRRRAAPPRRPNTPAIGGRLDQLIGDTSVRPSFPTLVDPRNFSTGVINPVGEPPANASPPPAIGGSLNDAIRGLESNAPSLGPVANNGSLPNIGMNRLPRARAEFGMPPSTGVVSNPLLPSDGNFPFMPGQGNPFGFANPEVFYGNQPSIGGPTSRDNIPPAVGFGGTPETGYVTPFTQRPFQGNVPSMGNPGQAVGFGGTAETGYMTPFGNFGLFGQPLLSNGMTQFRGNVGFPASNTGLGQFGMGLFGQPNQFNNMNANQGMGQSLGSMGSQGFSRQFNNMQTQMPIQQFGQQGQLPAFMDSFAFRPL